MMVFITLPSTCLLVLGKVLPSHYSSFGLAFLLYVQDALLSTSLPLPLALVSNRFEAFSSKNSESFLRVIVWVIRVHTPVSVFSSVNALMRLCYIIQPIVSESYTQQHPFSVCVWSLLQHRAGSLCSHMGSVTLVIRSLFYSIATKCNKRSHSL